MTSLSLLSPHEHRNVCEWAMPEKSAPHLHFSLLANQQSLQWRSLHFVLAKGTSVRWHQAHSHFSAAVVAAVLVAVPVVVVVAVDEEDDDDDEEDEEEEEGPKSSGGMWE